MTSAAQLPTIRAVTVLDATRVSDIYRPYVENTAVSFETEAPSAEQMQNRIETITSQYPWIVCEADGQVVGYAYASQYRERRAYRWCVDVAVYLDQTFQGQGLGRLLYESLFAQLRDLRYLNAFAGITLPNNPSVGLHRHMGFAPIGVYQSVGFKLGGWHDVQWWQLRLNEYPAKPLDPTAAVTSEGRVKAPE